MTHLLVQGKNDSEHESTPQTDSLCNSSVNHALIAIAQEVTELLKQAYPVQVDEIDRMGLIDENSESFTTSVRDSTADKTGEIDAVENGIWRSQTSLYKLFSPARAI
uniref:hypothetical protein n=1 Tax=Petrachloros mirabilis TaxID=2918835 RepID=UPI001EE8716A|nr:hypothetical protein [Petrachloros mirabilis]